MRMSRRDDDATAFFSCSRSARADADHRLPAEPWAGWDDEDAEDIDFYDDDDEDDEVESDFYDDEEDDDEDDEM